MTVCDTPPTTKQRSIPRVDIWVRLPVEPYVEPVVEPKKELSVKQIEELLGYEVKIVK